MGKRGPKPRLFIDLYEVADGCWPWVGSFYSNGYGRFNSTTAHRFMFEVLTGPLPPNLVVMHACDNRACVNPSHLSLGTPAENLADMVAKGRSLRGSRNAAVRLNVSDIRTIRDAVEAGETKASVARRYGVAEQTIRAVTQRLTWGWVA